MSVTEKYKSFSMPENINILYRRRRFSENYVMCTIWYSFSSSVISGSLCSSGRAGDGLLLTFPTLTASEFSTSSSSSSLSYKNIVYFKVHLDLKHQFLCNQVEISHQNKKSSNMLSPQINSFYPLYKVCELDPQLPHIAIYKYRFDESWMNCQDQYTQLTIHCCSYSW